MNSGVVHGLRCCIPANRTSGIRGLACRSNCRPINPILWGWYMLSRFMDISLLLRVLVILFPWTMILPALIIPKAVFAAAGAVDAGITLSDAGHRHDLTSSQSSG